MRPLYNVRLASPRKPSVPKYFDIFDFPFHILDTNKHFKVNKLRLKSFYKTKII